MALSPVEKSLILDGICIGVGTGGGTGGLCPPNFYVSATPTLTANNSKLITTSCAPPVSTTSYAYDMGWCGGVRGGSGGLG